MTVRALIRLNSRLIVAMRKLVSHAGWCMLLAAAGQGQAPQSKVEQAINANTAAVIDSRACKYPRGSTGMCR
jgi:hypothetical protein